MSDEDRPTIPFTTDESSESSLYPGEFTELVAGVDIGPYRLLRQVGEGGMGVVWLAEQHEPIARQVALKIIKPGMDTKRVVARFATEQQVLARLDHPAIARVYDAGTTAAGRPFFVMEYIRGIAITNYCDQNRLNTNERIALFIKVCEGVQAAHQKAIIHRDIKPHNVLVTIQGDESEPKIIDFGMAKATDQRLGDQPLHTEIGHFIGTPEYMSPEQAEVTGLDIDTRTDVYSLGALLYELFTGEMPFGSRDLKKNSVEEIRRSIREDDPMPPSARVSRLGPESKILTSRQSASVDNLRREVRGDLDWITLKAMEKDRTRRYSSPKELADDLRRFLNNEAVLASPPSVSYKLGKFVRRHRVGVALAAASTLLIIAFAATMAVQADRIAKERDRANAEAETSHQVSEFLVDLFGVSDPSESRGNTVTAREILDAGAQRVQTDLADQPVSQVTLMRTMGRVYTELSLYAEAEELLEESVKLAAENQDVSDLDRAAGLYELAKLYSWTNRPAESRDLAQQSLQLREKELGDNHLLVAQSLNALGNALQHLNQLDESAAAHRRALRIREQAGPEHSHELAASVHNLAIVHYFRGDLAEAEKLYQRAAELELRIGGADNHNYATTLHTLAIVYKDQQRYEEAIESELIALEIREKVLGPDHTHVGYSLSTLGELYRLDGRPAAAEAPGLRAFEVLKGSQGIGHPESAWARGNYVSTLLVLDKTAAAEEVLQTSLAENEATGKPDGLPSVYEALGELRRDNNRLDEAANYFNLAIAAGRNNPDADPARVGLSLAGLARVVYAQNDLARAELLYTESLAVMAEGWGKEDVDRQDVLAEYIEFLEKTDQPEKAAKIRADG